MSTELRLTSEEMLALEDCIEHWKLDIIEPLSLNLYRGGKHGPAYCALCRMYYYDFGCRSCPLDRAGVGCCDDGSPYDVFTKARRNLGDGPQTLEAAIDMLLSLREIKGRALAAEKRVEANATEAACAGR